MKKITLTQNRFALLDDDDYERVKHISWFIQNSSNRYYVRAFIEEDGIKKSLFLQHLILGKAPKGTRLFFKDGNSLNCQKSNLEFISSSTASHNYYKKRKPSKNSKEKFRGVTVLYLAKIKYKNKVISLGQFTNEADAARAYNLKAQELYGLHAITNEI